METNFTADHKMEAIISSRIKVVTDLNTNECFVLKDGHLEEKHAIMTISRYGKLIQRLEKEAKQLEAFAV